MAEENSNLLQVAQALRDELDAFLAGTAEASGMRSILEFAAQYIPVAENDRTSCKGKHLVGAERRRGLIAVQRQTTCEHSCPEHKEVMSPALWGALPKDLLQIVFARLPLAEISRLRCLSKEWKTSIDTAHSEFNQVCEAINSTNSFALITTDFQQHGVFWVRVFDMKSNRWHAFEIISHDQYCVALAACDGGLVCLLSMSPEDSSSQLFLTVWNLLTREKNELPVLDHLKRSYYTMVQLFVDPRTKHYKVMVANDKIYDSGIQERAYVYDSQSRQWSKVEKSSSVILGKSYSWPHMDRMKAETVDIRSCKYDFAEARLHGLNSKVEPWKRANLESYAVLEDRLFVLHGFEDEGRYLVFCISEYHAHVNPGSAQSGSNWLFERTHSCGPFENAPVYFSRTRAYSFLLFAYKGFLLVCAENEENDDSPYHYQRLWLYDLTTGKWRDLPNSVKCKAIYGYDIMCELRPWHILR